MHSYDLRGSPRGIECYRNAMRIGFWWKPRLQWTKVVGSAHDGLLKCSSGLEIAVHKETDSVETAR